ncbi:MAG: response regulator [Chloroflexi bacterium]|nr:response regulator [Chloroflexota bacterium]
MSQPLRIHPDPGVHDAAVQLDALRADALLLFLTLGAIGYVAWHYAYISVWATADTLARADRIFVVAVPLLVGAFVLLPRSQLAATGVCVGGGLLTISWALYSLDTVRGAILYAMLAMVAAIVIHPLGGALVAVVAVGLLVLLGTARPGLVDPVDVWSTAVFAGLAVAGVWVLTRHLLLALNWYVNSFGEAERRTREAEEHRAQLVRAWKQLDAAYYRLERANAALQLAWKAADEAERSKMELALNISHELRTPLNLIVGYSEMMMTSPGSYGNTPLPTPYRGDLYAVYSSAQHLLALTDDVLDLARMEVGSLALRREPVDLGQVVRDAAALVRDYVEAKGLELRLELPEALSPLMLDRLRIRQVLLNLLTNAARFTQRGWIAVQVLQREHDVRVDVRDTGAGIAPDDLPRVFQRFVTRQSPGGDWQRGVGLGLPISKRLVEMHGGTMGVDSALGAGTTFWFTVPSVPSDVDVAAGGSVGLSPAYLRPYQPVLVLAQTPAAVAGLLQRHLEGCQIEVTDTLAEARALAMEVKATAIITDLDAPDEPASESVPVFRCPLPRSRRIAQELGVADYLIKPISREALASAIGALGDRVRHVLIVDDDTSFVRLLARLLNSDGHEYVISTAHNGEEALARLQVERPDLLLLDLVMPGLDGIGVLSSMANQPELAGIRVIIISAHGDDGAVPLGRELRVSKPEGFHLAELTRLIAAMVEVMAPVRAHLSPQPSAISSQSSAISHP